MKCARPDRFCASAICRVCEYKGFVEGDDIGKGTVDVVVTEGFAGNIALKSAEGTARQIAGYLRAEMRRTRLDADRLSAGARRPFAALGEKARSRPLQWRRLSRPERHRHQEPWRRRRQRLRRRHRHRLRHGASRIDGEDRTGAGAEKRVVAEAAISPMRRRHRWPEPHRDIAFRDSGRRLLSAGAGRHQ